MSKPSVPPWKHRSPGSPEDVPGFLVSGAEFEDTFDLELCRSERSRQPLALVIFTPLEGPRASLTGLLEILAKRKRLPDTVGRMPAGAIGVLLPYTSRVGAWSFADAVLLCLGAEAAEFRAQVSTSDDGVWSDHDSSSESRPKAMEPLGRPPSLGKVGGLVDRKADPPAHARPAPRGGDQPSDETNTVHEPHRPRSASSATAPKGALTPAASAPHTLVLERPPPRRAPRLLAVQESRRGVLQSNRPSTDIWRHFATRPALWKRALDFTASGLALVVLAPAFLGIAILIKKTSPGPVFFRQKRAGELGRPFTLFKFRSMYIDAEARKRDLMHLNEMDGPAFKMKDDPRVTPLGRFLRTSSIDELPQFINVFRGEMSLVGPRPPTMDELPGYERWHRRRLSKRGGLTCIWQTSGRNLVTFQEWMRMDMRYLRKESLGTDVALIFKTVWTVVLRRGAS